MAGGIRGEPRWVRRGSPWGFGSLFLRLSGPVRCGWVLWSARWVPGRVGLFSPGVGFGLGFRPLSAARFLVRVRGPVLSRRPPCFFGPKSSNFGLRGGCMSIPSGRPLTSRHCRHLSVSAICPAVPVLGRPGSSGPAPQVPRHQGRGDHTAAPTSGERIIRLSQGSCAVVGQRAVELQQCCRSAWCSGAGPPARILAAALTPGLP